MLPKEVLPIVPEVDGVDLPSSGDATNRCLERLGAQLVRERPS